MYIYTYTERIKKTTAQIVTVYYALKLYQITYSFMEITHGTKFCQNPNFAFFFVLYDLFVFSVHENSQNTLGWLGEKCYES